MVFLAATFVVTLAGIRIISTADRLADRTGLGEAVFGGILLGASTSLSGIVTSLTAASAGLASLAVSNAVGGIAAQTTFLVIADLIYKRVNLEHAAADANNMLMAAMLVLLMSLPLAANYAPEYTLFGIHPASLLLFAVYFFGTRAAVQLRNKPMWRPRETDETREDAPDEEEAQIHSLPVMIAIFVGLSLVLAACGYAIAQSGAVISSNLGISQTIVGALMTAVATSLPELVTTLAAVRRGALQLAVGGIIGGNTFDVLFLSLSDIAYRDGSIYHAMTQADGLMLIGATVITTILLMGLILRERRGIGFEGLGILVTYFGLMALQVSIN
ncbi:sodium:calcium antiporter [Henriciella marina]|uniref:Sodium:calcium antiporter n=1 Tax=Henriciella marina TaxID=453851 RepID=A0ABT4LTJ3_9PROT|nr:sodium:calcium antiporter [Henriciella marina]MCZ4297675.1 sodium:calcium antiporter [Henriciella marina]